MVLLWASRPILTTYDIYFLLLIVKAYRPFEKKLLCLW